MRADCLCKVLVGVAVMALVACSSGKKSGSTLAVDGGAGSGGSAGSGTGGTGGSTFGGAGGQGGAAGQGGSAGQGTGGAGGGTSCSDFGQTAKCTACLEKNCCAESAACSADATCKAFVACAEKCPDPINNTSSTCMQNCIAQDNPVGGPYNPLLQCMETKCPSPTCNYM